MPEDEGALTLNPAYTGIRVQGGAEEPQVFPPLAEGHDIAARGASCPSCGGLFRIGERLAAIPLGPGDEEQDRRQRRAGGWYSCMAILVHAECYGVSYEPGLATRVHGASETLREVAEEMRRRETDAAEDQRDIPKVSSEMGRLADNVDKASQQVAQWEETTG